MTRRERTDQNLDVGMQSADFRQSGDEEIDPFAVHESGDADDGNCINDRSERVEFAKKERLTNLRQRRLRFDRLEV